MMRYPKKIFNFENISLEKIIDYGGVFLIGMFCLCYSIFVSNFAELHLTLPFLNFPIFIGEILLGFCLALSFIKYKLNSFTLKLWQYWVLFYILWVLIKAFGGYFAFGPLAFRNAALFYYPLFAVLGYYFYRREFFNQKLILSLLVIFIAAKSTINFSNYYILPVSMLCVILALKIRRTWVRYFFLFLLALVLSRGNFFHDSKTTVIGNVTGFLFLAYCLSSMSVKLIRNQRIAVIFIVGLLLAVALLKYGNKNQIRALARPLDLIPQLERVDAYIRKEKANFHSRNLAVSIYNPNPIEFSDDIFLRFYSARHSAIRKKAIESLSQEEIVSCLNEDMHAARIAVVRAIKGAKEIGVVALKHYFKSVDGQIRVIHFFEEAVEMIAQKALESLEQQKKLAIENVTIFLERQKKNPVSLEEAQADIAKLSTISPEAIIQEVTRVINTERNFLIDAVSRPVAMARLKEAPGVTATKDLPVSSSVMKDLPVSSSSDGVSSPRGLGTSYKEAAPKEIKNTAPEASSRKEDAQKEISRRDSEIFALEELASLTDSEKQKRIERIYEQDATAKNTITTTQPSQDMKSVAVDPNSVRPLSEEYSNMLFRLLVWRDMFDELIKKPSSLILGVNFGKPQRSISNEILAAAYGDWMRDGWITPHNSYFSLIYRGGVMGMAVIIVLLFVFSRLIRKFMLAKSLTGILLVSILVYYLTISNFLVVLELPYHAIPFWSLFGMTLAFSRSLNVPILTNQPRGK